MDSDRAEIVRLAALATGDEKHEACSYSTLDALLGAVRPRPARRPGATPPGRIATASSSARDTGRAPFYAVLAAQGFFPEDWLRTASLAWGEPPGRPSRPAARCRASRRPPARSATGCRWPSASRSRSAPGLDEQRVVVLTGDAELNEGSNWEAILLAPHLGLDNLTLLVIDNHSSSIPMVRRWTPRLGAFGWDAESSTATTTTRSTPRSRAPRRRPPDRGRRGHPGGRVVSRHARSSARATVTDAARGRPRVAVVLAEISTDLLRARARARPAARRQRRHHGADHGRRRRRLRAGGLPSGRAHDHAVPGRARARAGQARLRLPGARRHVRRRRRLLRLRTRGATHHSPGDVQALATIPGIADPRAPATRPRSTRCSGTRSASAT